MAGPGGGNGKGPGPSRWERVVAGVGALLVAATIAFTAREALTGRDGPPRLVVEADSVLPSGDGGYLVQLRVRNHGGRTAAEVEIEGELTGPDGRVERVGVTLDYVPRGGSQRAGLLFRGDPRAAALRLRAVGYRSP